MKERMFCGRCGDIRLSFEIISSHSMEGVCPYIFNPTNQRSHFQPTAPVKRIKVDALYQPTHSFFFILVLCKNHTIAATVSNLANGW
jgi:hypothetical protein